MPDDVVVERADVLQALSRVPDPELGGNIVSQSRIREIKICEGNIAFELLLTSPDSPVKGRLEEACRAAVMQIPGVTLVNVRFHSSAG